MPSDITTPSQYNQSAFTGGMNLLSDDSRLQPNQYRIGFNMTNRYDQLDTIFQAVEDVAIPSGLKQEIVTFGNYIIVFIKGFAYYRYYSDTGWRLIDGFSMSPTAPRYWTVLIPVATTNYVRYSATGTINATAADNTSNPTGAFQYSIVQGASAGNLPGLLVQDNINQPQFIFLDASGIPTVRVTQKFNQWLITFTDATNTVVTNDQREYVPIGSSMAWDNGVLYITSQDGNFIYPSVTGRPLDFVRNVTNILADNTTTPPNTQYGGGDASTTSYSVGVGGITCLRPLATGGILITAGIANFAVTQNMSNNTPLQFGEYPFIRTFLFNATCLSDRVILDSIGDTRFIDLTGIRSFNAVSQEQNEGRNSAFTATIQAAFGPENNPIIQDAGNSAAILFNNYEHYAVNTIFGAAIAKYDTINNCWTSFDIQTKGKRIKIFAKIELTIQRLYAITEDDRLYTLYIGPLPAIGTVRTVGVCANMLYANQNVKMNNPDSEVKLQNFRCIVNNITKNTNVTFTPFVNNRITPVGTISKKITYVPPITISTSSLNLPDVNTQLTNLLYSIPNASQGWKVFGVVTWDTGSITQYSMELENLTPMNPLVTQGIAV